MTNKQLLNLGYLLPRIAPNWRLAHSVLDFEDGYNRPMDNKRVTNVLGDEETHFDLVVCNNVLNTKSDLSHTIERLARLSFDVLVIRIDEGTCAGNPTRRQKTYQRNERIEAYLRPLQQSFFRHDVTLHRSQNCIVISRGARFWQGDEALGNE